MEETILVKREKRKRGVNWVIFNGIVNGENNFFFLGGGGVACC